MAWQVLLPWPRHSDTHPKAFPHKQQAHSKYSHHRMHKHLEILHVVMHSHPNVQCMQPCKVHAKIHMCRPSGRRHGPVYRRTHIQSPAQPLHTEAKSHHFPLCSETQELYLTALCVHSSIANHELSSPPSLLTSALQFRLITLLCHMINCLEIGDLLMYPCQVLWCRLLMPYLHRALLHMFTQVVWRKSYWESVIMQTSVCLPSITNCGCRKEYAYDCR